MKNLILPLTVAAALLVFTNFKCEKDIVTDKLSSCIKGRLIIKGPCAQFAVQVLEGDTAHVDVARTWKDPETGIDYNNVFTVKNYCNFSVYAAGDEFWFYVIKLEKTMECITCAAVRATPAVFNEIATAGTSCP